jgi:hypothetical protein
MKPMPFTLDIEDRTWRRRGFLAGFTAVERQIILSSTRPPDRSETHRQLWKPDLYPAVIVAADSLNIVLDKSRTTALVDAAYEISRLRDWEERRIQKALRKGILRAPHDGCMIEDKLRPLTEPCEDLKWCRKPMGPHASLALSGKNVRIQDRVDHPRRLRAEAAVQRGIVPTDKVEIRFAPGGSNSTFESSAATDRRGVQRITRVVRLNRPRWTEVLRLGLDDCENGLVLAVRHAVADEPWGHLFEVVAAQRGQRLIRVTQQLMYAVAAKGSRVRLFADLDSARGAFDNAGALYWASQPSVETEEPMSDEDAAALGDLGGPAG